MVNELYFRLTHLYEEFLYCVAESSDMPVEPLPEDKARRALERLKLLSKIREVILPHPLLDERLKLCQPSADIPDWWVPGKHDKDLLIGVAK